MAETLPTPLPATDAEGGLVFAVHLPGVAAELGEQRLDWAAITPASPASPGVRAAAAAAGPPPLWINLDRMCERAQRWIRESAGLDPTIADGLLEDLTRPRVQDAADGMLVILRGVNLNPGAEPDELISMRMWVDPSRIITLRQHRFRTLADLRVAAESGRAPATTGGMLARIAAGLASRIGPSVDNLEDLLDEVEAEMLERDDEVPGARGRLSEIRRQAISLRRHLLPQRQAMQELANFEHPVLDRADRGAMRAAAEQVARAVDSLEEIRDRAAVTQDELRARHETRVGRTLYLLTIVATIALPLGIITGLLGINVGGIPLSESPWGFAVVCGVLALIAVGEVVLFRRMRML